MMSRGVNSSIEIGATVSWLALAYDDFKVFPPPLLFAPPSPIIITTMARLHI